MIKRIRIVTVVSSFICLLSLSSWAKAPELSQHTSRQVQQAYKFQLDEQWSKAIKILEDARPNRTYDKAYLHRMLGGLYWQNQQPKQAINHLMLAADSNVLPSEQYKETQRMLADILLMEGLYERSEKRYQILVKEYQKPKELEALWLRMAQAQYQQQKWQAVEVSIQKQQQYLNASNLAIKVQPLNMMLTAQISLNKLPGAIETALLLRDLESKNFLWWRQLIALYIQTEQTTLALITLQQADRLRFDLTEQQLTLMAQLYAQTGVPYKAAQTYERVLALSSYSEDKQSLQRLRLLEQQAQYWQLAKEWDKAQQSWREAAVLDPQFNWQIAVLHLQTKNYESALSSINRLLQHQTELDYSNTTLAKIHITQTQALNALGLKKAALEAATKAHKLTPTKESLRWIEYLSVY